MNEGEAHDGGPVFWIGAGIGWTIIVVGVVIGLRDRDVKPFSLVAWVLGGLVLHDALWLTVVAVAVAGAAWLLRRRVPVAVAWAIGTTVVLSLIAWPFVRGYGRRADVPSALQRNYARGLLMYVLVVWAIAGAVCVAAAVARRRRARRPVEGLVGDDS